MTPCVYLMSCGTSREVETDVSSQDQMLSLTVDYINIAMLLN